jgi:DNA polymerase-3 subunit gamma/tau
MNVYELDAAAHGKIDDIRRVIEMVNIPPVNNARYKIFIIDEAHELTDSAADAFLKTLEEPPEYVIFILATTEPNKFKQTIISRCQVYNFKRITVDDMQKYLRHICDEEKIEADDNALHFIAIKGDGSMRESISLLDRCSAYSTGEKITLEIVMDILGIVEDSNFKELALAINRQQIIRCLQIINQCIENGKELQDFTSDFILHLRNVLIIKHLNEENELLQITKQKYEELKEESAELTDDTILFYIERLSNVLKLMKVDENKRILLETCIIRLATPSSNYIEPAVISRISEIEEKIAKGSFVKVENIKSIQNTKTEEKPAEKANEKTENTTKEKAPLEIKVSANAKKDYDNIISNWKMIIKDLSMVEKSILSKDNLTILPSSTNEGTLLIIPKNEIIKAQIDKVDYASFFQKSIKDNLNIDVVVKITNIKNDNKENNIDKITQTLDMLNSKGLDINKS